MTESQLGPLVQLKLLREQAGLTITEVAHRAGTSRTTLSAYEHGHKSPTTATLQRILTALNAKLTITASPTFTTHIGHRGKPFHVPSTLPTLPLDQAVRHIEMPIRLAWSGQKRSRNLALRDDRKFVYRQVIEEGSAQDILTYIDGRFLVDLWDDMPIAPAIQKHWEPLIDQATA